MLIVLTAIQFRAQPGTALYQLCMKVAISVMGPPIVIEAGLFGPE
jgi:hypothetical protein